ncbi:MAG: glycerol-3-phosphate acyltransferase [Candidatus Aminicenantales bacterium]
MAAMDLLTWFSIVLMGYIIGSISPSYILGKVLKKIDIREHGTKNAGTLNTYKILGLGPAIITALFDLSKGLLAMWVAHTLGASLLHVHLVGFAAIFGHVFPFYLRFRGGQGVATATAILIYYLGIFYARAWLPWDSLLLLAFCVLSFVFIAKKGEIVGVVVLPVLTVFILVFSPSHLYQILIISIIAYILFINIQNIRHFHLLKSSEKMKKEINWRLYLRPLAVILLINYLKTDKKDTLVLIGVITLLFLFLDLIRLTSKKINVFFFKTIKSLYKSKEYKKFSSITLFLFAIFLTILLFEQAIAVLAVSFLIFGDFFSKFFGLHYGQRKIFEKSLEGSLAHFTACLLSGYVFLQFVPFSIPIFMTGALVASVAEFLPMGVDDNFSVALLSAATMSVFHLF